MVRFTIVYDLNWFQLLRYLILVEWSLCRFQLFPPQLTLITYTDTYQNAFAISSCWFKNLSRFSSLTVLKTRAHTGAILIIFYNLNCCLNSKFELLFAANYFIESLGLCFTNQSQSLVCWKMIQALVNAFKILLICFSQSAWTSDDQIHIKGGFIGNRNHVSFIFLGYWNWRC